MKTNITYLILAVITTICISCESHNQPEEQHGFVTYTLSSTTTIEQSGTPPESSVATYDRTTTTGKKGQMTAGNSTRLELKGWDGCTIKRVELQMHSNTRSGAGSLSLVIGNDTLWQIDNQPFSDKSWAGGYTTNWLPITRSMNTIVKENDNPEWKVGFGKNDNCLTCLVEGNVFKVKCTNEYSLIGETFTITASSERGSKSIIVEVISL